MASSIKHTDMPSGINSSQKSPKTDANGKIKKNSIIDTTKQHVHHVKVSTVHYLNDMSHELREHIRRHQEKHPEVVTDTK